MTNGEKYKTAEERAKAFIDYCEHCWKTECLVSGAINCFAHWLELEAEEEKPLPCPFCGKECNVIDFNSPIGFICRIGCIECAYSSKQYKTRDDAIAAHNRVAKKCMEVKE